MLERSASVPMSKRPEGMATTKPATQVENAGSAEARMDAGEDLGQQAVARHGEPDARLAKLIDEDGGDHAHEGAEENDQPDPVKLDRRRERWRVF